MAARSSVPVTSAAMRDGVREHGILHRRWRIYGPGVAAEPSTPGQRAPRGIDKLVRSTSTAVRILCAVMSSADRLMLPDTQAEGSNPARISRPHPRAGVLVTRSSPGRLLRFAHMRAGDGQRSVLEDRNRGCCCGYGYSGSCGEQDGGEHCYSGLHLAQLSLGETPSSCLEAHFRTPEPGQDTQTRTVGAQSSESHLVSAAPRLAESECRTGEPDRPGRLLQRPARCTRASRLHRE